MRYSLKLLYNSGKDLCLKVVTMPTSYLIEAGYLLSLRKIISQALVILQTLLLLGDAATREMSMSLVLVVYSGCYSISGVSTIRTRFAALIPSRDFT